VANVNRCLFIGRVGSDVEVREFSGSKLARFRFVVNNRKKDQQTGEWGDVPCWIDAECWQSGNSTLAERLAQHLRKGTPVYLEARLEYDEWQDQQGNRRSKHKLVITDWQFVEPRPKEQGTTGYAQRPPQGGQSRPQAAPQRPPQQQQRPQARPPAREPTASLPSDDGPPVDEESIPF
jgi:single-strand DNA-binding protein